MFNRKLTKDTVKYYVAFKENKRDLGVFAKMAPTVLFIEFFFLIQVVEPCIC